MRNLVLIREYVEATDRVRCQELSRSVIMSFSNAAFVEFTLREFTFQIMILTAAVMFIFFGFPLVWCLATIPAVIIMVYAFSLGTHAFKASEQMQIPPLQRWVAEAYEPYFMMTDPKMLHYEIVNDKDFRGDDYDIKNLQRKIIGVVNLRNFIGPKNSLWMYGLAVDPRYRGKSVGKSLVNKTIAYGRSKGYNSIELVTTDLQSEARILFQKEGFELHQIYHKQFLGTMLTLGMYELSIKLH